MSFVFMRTFRLVSYIRCAWNEGWVVNASATAALAVRSRPEEYWAHLGRTNQRRCRAECRKSSRDVHGARPCLLKYPCYQILFTHAVAGPARKRRPPVMDQAGVANECCPADSPDAFACARAVTGKRYRREQAAPLCAAPRKRYWMRLQLVRRTRTSRAATLISSTNRVTSSAAA